MQERMSLIFSFIAGVVAYFLGGFDALLSIFTIILILDTITGMLKAFNLGKYESSKFRSGFVKKMAYMLGVVLSVQIDLLVKSNGALRTAVLTFFITNEAFSIVENLGEMGVGFPDILKNSLKTLKDKNDENK